jgi:hypothetical protein
VLFGGIALLWRDPATWQNLRHIWSLPLGGNLGAGIMAAQIAGGFGVLYPRTVRPASAVLCLVYLCFSLACIPDIIAAANLYDKFGGSFFLFLSLFFGSLAVFASAEQDQSKAALFGRGARLGLGVCSISFALGQGLLLRQTAGAVPKWIPPGQMFWAIATTAAFALAAGAMLSNRHARLAVRLLTLMVGLFGGLVWAPLLTLSPREHFLWSELAETLLVTGAAWSIGDLKHL